MPMLEPRPLIFDNDAIGFYVTSGDHDLLLQIRKHLQRSGYIGIADTAGRLHYIVDGTRGTPFAARRILETTDRHQEEQNEQLKQKERILPEVIERILEQNGIRTELKGRAFLNQMLLIAAVDDRQLRPISKTLYPEVARHFHVRISQIERDVRYALASAIRQKDWPESLGTGNSARISYLCAEVHREMRRLIFSDDQLPASATPARMDTGNH